MLANLLYLIALSLLSPWILYRRVRHGRYRRGWKQKLLGLSARDAARLLGDNPGHQRVWFHAVSVGEILLLRGVVTELRRRHPDVSVVISTSTDSGYEVAQKHFGQEQVFFCPLDFSWAVGATLKHLRPTVLALAELELWPNLVQGARAHGTKVVVINARLGESSAEGYQRFGWITRSIFASLDQVLCQNEATAERFVACGANPKHVSVTGSLKFDNAPNSRDNVDVQTRASWAGIDPWQTVWMVGSTQEGEERMAIEIYRRVAESHRDLRLILVPRHPERFSIVADQIRAAGLIPHRRSCDPPLEKQTWEADRVILIDTIGELRHWWGVCQIATVGGSFSNRGGQNMLEPAGYGCAVSFGPNTRNFRQIAQSLLDAGGAVRVGDKEELEQFVRRCLDNIPDADAMGRAARIMIEEHRGATRRTVDAIRSALDNAPQRQHRLDESAKAA